MGDNNWSIRYESSRKEEIFLIIEIAWNFSHMLKKGYKILDSNTIALERTDLFEAVAKKLNTLLMRSAVPLSLIRHPVPLKKLEIALAKVLFSAEATKKEINKPITQGFGIKVSFVVSIMSLKGLALDRISP